MSGPSPAYNSQLISSLGQQATGGTGAAPIFLGAKLDLNVGTGHSIQGNGLKFDATFKPVAQAAPGPIAKLLESTGVNRKAIFEGLQKVAQAAPVQQADSGSVYGRGADHGLGGFSASSLGSGGYDIP
jgi:hypothetical protein